MGAVDPLDTPALRPLRHVAAVLAAGLSALILPSSAAVGATHGSAPAQGISSTLKSLGQQIKRGAKNAENAATKFARYAKNAAAMRTHHDGGDLDPGAITDFLRKKGIGPKGAKPAPNAARAGAAPVMTYKGTFDWPLEAGIVSSEFGPRWGKFHAGIDIAADIGDSVIASAPGVVIYAGNGLSGYGNVVIIRTDANTTTLYGHNSKLDVHEGDTVEQGARIARVGSTGRSTGPHVHFEIRSGDTAINPRDRLPANKYIGK